MTGCSCPHGRTEGVPSGDDTFYAQAWGALPALTAEDCAAVERFQELLRLRTVSGEGVQNGSYRAASVLLQKWLAEAGAENIRAIEYTPDKPVVLATFPGTELGLKSILLNGHYDVVPSMPDKWTVDPFSAARLEDGCIYGRGTQDMKCVVVQYIEALRNLRGVSRRRTIHVSFMPDEEVGGLEGARLFAESPEFTALNAGVALDEGLASGPQAALVAFHGERAPNWLLVRATGPTGHGSRFIEGTAVEKLVTVMSRCYKVRAQQQAILEGAGGEGSCAPLAAAKLGDVLTLNITAMDAGVRGGFPGGFALNVVPESAVCGIDIRVPLSIDRAALQALLDSWLEGLEGVTVEFVTHTDHPTKQVDLERDPWWLRFVEGLQPHTVSPEVFPAATDGRFWRRGGLPCFGFSPLPFTPILLHDHNERISERVFAQGIRIYEKLLLHLADAPLETDV